MLTKISFTIIVVMIFLRHLFLLQLSQQHIKILIAQGGRMHGSKSLKTANMILKLGWFVSMSIEVWWLNSPFIPLLSGAALVAVVTAQVLRQLSMEALGVRWTFPIITLPRSSVVESGIYRYLRHPNWLGVLIEIGAVPLLHGAYFSAIFFTLANALVIHQRIQEEEDALRKDTNYDEIFANRPWFIPSLKQS
jgi:methyltransferase